MTSSERELHPLPSAVDLLEAVEDWLRAEVVPGPDGRVGFHARVAANVVGMVRRELLAGDAALVAHRERLAQLGVSTERELAEAIAAGTYDDREDELVAALRAAALAALEVANPAHLELPPEPALPDSW